MGFAMSWLGALVGLSLRSPEAVSALSGVVMMPLAFLSNAFVPPEGLPGWMRVVVEWNPVSAVVSAARDLFGNERGPSSGAFPSEHPVTAALVVLLVLLAVVVPLMRPGVPAGRRQALNTPYARRGPAPSGGAGPRRPHRTVSVCARARSS